MLAIDPKAIIASPAEVNAGIIEWTDTNPPSGFYTPPWGQSLWTLLQAIKTAGIPLSGKIAEYAGFYNDTETMATAWDSATDNGTNPDQDQTGTNQPNKSLDKLTFLIMFRLPFWGEVVTVSPPLTDPVADLYNNREILKNVSGTDTTYLFGAFHESSEPVALTTHTITRPNPIADFEIGGRDLFYDSLTATYFVPEYFINNFGNPLDQKSTTWSKKANDIRAAAGLRLLNGAGEQVALFGTKYEHVDNDGQIVSFEYDNPDTANAYAYYKINFNDLDPGSGRPESITDQDLIAAIKTLPLYYFLTIYTENPPQRMDQSAGPANEWYATKKQPKKPPTEYAKRSIKFGTYNSLGGFIADATQPASSGLDNQIIKRDATNRYYVIPADTTPMKFLAQELPGEDFTADKDFTSDPHVPGGALLTGLKVNFVGNTIYAEDGDKISQGTTRWHSGLTFGFGCDAGVSQTAHAYKVFFTIQRKTGVAASAEFNLHYDWRGAPVTGSGLAGSLAKLMRIDPALVTVVPSPAGTVFAAGYSAGWDVTIQQQVGLPVKDTKTAANEFYNIYSHELFYHEPSEATPRLLITPVDDTQRFILRTESELPAITSITPTADIQSTDLTIALTKVTKLIERDLVSIYSTDDPANKIFRFIKEIDRKTKIVTLESAVGQAFNVTTGRIGVHDGHFSSFIALLNSFYYSGDFTAPDPVYDGGHRKRLTNGDAVDYDYVGASIPFDTAKFKDVVEKVYGLQRWPAVEIYLDNKTLCNDFRMPKVSQTIKAMYLRFYSVRYYTPDMVKADVLNNIAKGAFPNILEKVLYSTISYGGISRWWRRNYACVLKSDGTLTRKDYKGLPRKDPGIAWALSSHNQYALKEIFTLSNQTLDKRRMFLVGYVERFQQTVYRGVEA